MIETKNVCFLCDAHTAPIFTIRLCEKHVAHVYVRHEIQVYVKISNVPHIVRWCTVYTFEIIEYAQPANCKHKLRVR